MRRFGPLINPCIPVFLWRSGIPWDNVQMQVGNLIAKDKEVDMLGALTGFERPAQARHQRAKRLRFLVRLLCQPWRMPLQLSDEVSQIDRSLTSADMPGVDQGVLVDGSPWYDDFSSVLLADETSC